MTTAERIMKKKAFIKVEMDREIGAARSDALWRAATERLADIRRAHGELPKGVRAHTDNYIFPSAAIYLTAADAVGRQTAYRIVENAAIKKTTAMGRQLAGLMKLPGMAGLFIRIWDPLTRRMFGASSGFSNVFYPKEKGAYRMDVTACPYCRYFAELGCPELTKIFCDNDERGYGNLPGIAFERTGTLGKGADRCDFRIRKV